MSVERIRFYRELFVMCLYSVEKVLLCPHWFLLHSLTSVTPVDKISIASSNSLCDRGWKMRALRNDLVSQCSFLSVMVMEQEQNQFSAANSWLEESILQLTPMSLCKHHIHYRGKKKKKKKPRDWKVISCLLSWHRFSKSPLVQMECG